MGISLKAFDAAGLKHLNNTLSRLEYLITTLQVQTATVPKPSTDMDSDQVYIRPEDLAAQELAAGTETTPEQDAEPITDQDPGGTVKIPSMAGYSPTVTMQKDGKHAIVDFSTWPGVGDPWVTHFGIYASTTTPCPIQKAYLKKTVQAHHTVVEITSLERNVTYDFRVAPMRKESRKNIIQGGASN